MGCIWKTEGDEMISAATRYLLLDGAQIENLPARLWFKSHMHAFGKHDKYTCRNSPLSLGYGPN